MLISGDLKCICFGLSAHNRDRNISEIQRERQRQQSQNTSCSLCLLVFASNCGCTITWGISLATFPLTGSDAFAWRDVYDSQEGGKTSHTGASEWKTQQEDLAVSQHPTHRASQRVSRTHHCCVTLKARWPEGGGCLLCQSSKARLAIFVPLQGQFAVCDLSKGNVTWQELLTSEEHQEGFWRYRPFLQF